MQTQERGTVEYPLTLGLVESIRDVVDWESPCGPAYGVVPRVHHPRHVFAGAGEAHWSGQPCELIGTASSDNEFQTVALACGCRAEVAASALVPAPRA